MEWPGLVLFGPQTTCPSSDQLNRLKDALVRNQELKALIDAIDTFPQLWETLQVDLFGCPAADSSSPYKQVADWFRRWSQEAGVDSSIIPENASLNSFLAPLTVIIQTVQYCEYLKSNGLVNSHTTLLDAIRNTGIQGQCIGFITAVVLSLAKDSASIQGNAAVAFRLAFCIGALVDHGRRASESPDPFRCIAVRRRRNEEDTKALLNFLEGASKHAYISVWQDDSTFTLTVPSQEITDLTYALKQRGYTAIPVKLVGCYHTASNTDSAQRLISICRSRSELRFCDNQELQLPLRSNTDGSVLSAENLSERAIELILVDICRWDKVIRTCLPLSRPERSVMAFGLVECLSAALAEQYGRTVKRFMDLKPISSICSQPADPSLEGPTVDLPEREKLSCRKSYPPNAVAIVGTACRFPGADSVEELWDVMKECRSMAREATDNEFCTTGLGRDKNLRRKYWGNFMNNIDKFDHKFFKMSSREAASTDPQQRLLLQTAYQALEDAGYFKHKVMRNGTTSTDVDVGCYIGCVAVDYKDHVAQHPPTAYSSLGTLRAFMSGRISHYFGWSGPSITYDTACSASTVAIHAACQALQLGECSSALAGGVNTTTVPAVWQNLGMANFLSPTGPTKAFDASADGYCRGEGVALVVLKRLQDAVADSDRIHGVITASVVNQSINTSSIVAPGVESQATLFRKALSKSGLRPEDISFVEAHGTGTQLGDKLESESINTVFGSPKRTSLHLGSIKSNIGHTESVAGVAGLIKVLLMMRKRIIPRQVNLSTLNPNMPDLGSRCIEIPLKHERWRSSYLAACVNNYGAAGSNAVMVVEQPPETSRSQQAPRQEASRTLPIIISAASETSLRKYLERLAKFLQSDWENHGTITLSDLVYNLNSKKNQALEWTFTAGASSHGELMMQLTDNTHSSVVTSHAPLIAQRLKGAKPIVLVFGGQHGLSMSLDKVIFDNSPIIRKHLLDCDSSLIQLGLQGIFPAILDPAISQDLVTYHCILFSIQYSLAKTWIECGLQISGVIGHSFGQLTAICISGSLTLLDVLKLISGRALLIQKYCRADRGSMVAIEGSSDDVQRLVNIANEASDTGKIEIACYNGPTNFVVAGPALNIQHMHMCMKADASLSLSLKLTSLEMHCAFHSSVMDAIIPEYLELAKGIRFSEPSIYVETCSDSLSWSEPSAKRIAEHTRGAVYFAQAIDRLISRLGPCIWLEAGIGSPVIPMTRRITNHRLSNNKYLPLSTKHDPWKSIIDATLCLWREGHMVHFWGLDCSDASKYSEIQLPPYQFDEVRHWLDYTDNYPSVVLKKDTETKGEQSPYISFLRFRGTESDTADFHVNRDHSKLKLLIEGHAVLGMSTCPLTMYTDLAFEASKYLANGCRVDNNRGWIPTFGEVEAHVVLSDLQTKMIKLVLTVDKDLKSSWLFEVLSTNEESTNAKPITVTHATGSVSLRAAAAQNKSKNFNALERLCSADVEQKIISECEQSMKGPVIYNTFSKIITYSNYYKGLLSIFSKDLEAIGHVQLSSCKERDLLESVCNPLDLESFGQVAGVNANCFREDADGDVFITNKLEAIHLGPEYLKDPCTPRFWTVYTKSQRSSDRLTISDVFVFDANTRQLAVAMLGIHLVKVATSSLLKVLQRASGSESERSEVPRASNKAVPQPDRVHSNDNCASHTASAEQTQDQFSIIKQLLSDILDAPVDVIAYETDLINLGIDSLMVSEILNAIQQKFGFEMSVSQFMGLKNVRQLCGLLQMSSNNSDKSSSTSTSPTPPSEENETLDESGSMYSNDSGLNRSSLATTDHDLVIDSDAVQMALDSVQRNFEELSIHNGVRDYWTDVHPDQHRLTVAYTVEALAKLDCPLGALKAGDQLPQIEILPEFLQLEAQLYRLLEATGLIKSSGSRYLRTSMPLEMCSSERIYAELLHKFSRYEHDLNLLHLTGPKLAECMAGKGNAIEIIFGNKISREILKNCYEKSPICKTVNAQLQNLLDEILQRCPRNSKVRILEIGAGTGGTTRVVLDGLTRKGFDYSYDFTDKSPSMVNKAKRDFQQYSAVTFSVLDIEADPPEALRGKYHIVISANCIHATSDLLNSTLNVRRLLRDDGILALIEHTRNIPWFDLVFGLLDGWWAFKDDRKHALADEVHWNTVLRKAAFEHVDWTRHHSREAQAIRVIVGFNRMPSATTQHPRSNRVIVHGLSPAHRKNFFAIPGGFGTASTFVPVPKLHDSIALYALNSPFLSCPDKFGVTFEVFTSLYLEEIRRVQPSGPYSLVGYSVGGVVAYEAVRQLLAEGEIVERLVLIDSACPLTVPPLPLAINDFLGNTDSHTGHFGKGSIGSPSAASIEHVEKTLACLGNYKPQPIPYNKAPPTALFTAREGLGRRAKTPRPKVSSQEDTALDWILNDRTEDPSILSGWEMLLGPTKLTTIYTDGNHFSLMNEPNVSMLAEAMRSYLETQY